MSVQKDTLAALAIEYTDADGKIDFESVAKRLGRGTENCRVTYRTYRLSLEKNWKRAGPFSDEDKQIILAKVEEARLNGTPSADIIKFGPFWKELGVLLGGRNPQKVRMQWADVLCKGLLPTW